MEAQIKIDLLKEAMDTAGMRPKDLAEKSGVAKGSISKILNSQCNPGIRTLQRISAVLDIPWHWFVVGSDSSERQGSQGMPTPDRAGE